MNSIGSMMRWVSPRPLWLLQPPRDAPIGQLSHPIERYGGARDVAQQSFAARAVFCADHDAGVEVEVLRLGHLRLRRSPTEARRVHRVARLNRAVVAHHPVAALLAVDDAWVAFAPDGRYRSVGDLRGNFWHAVGACRFEAGELDDWCDLRLPDGVPFDAPRGPLTAKPRPQTPVRPKRSPPPPSPPLAALPEPPSSPPVAPSLPALTAWPDALTGVCASVATFATCSLALGLTPSLAALGALAGGVCGALGSRHLRTRAR